MEVIGVLLKPERRLANKWPVVRDANLGQPFQAGMVRNYFGYNCADFIPYPQRRGPTRVLRDIATNRAVSEFILAEEEPGQRRVARQVSGCVSCLPSRLSGVGVALEWYGSQERPHARVGLEGLLGGPGEGADPHYPPRGHGREGHCPGAEESWSLEAREA